ncbi:flavin reductase (NADPH)-like [Anneissia japonica]|uniref:flavin reductase (NADPH)-like n=1 Tax=Anneissia japonica TaxID=1529436 RepID=UPI001425687D|nr:flavin reductase (NADPH)-like [Anneissia japonica]
MTLKVVVLGATGKTGSQVVDEALIRGHHVVAIVRNPSKITQKHANLKVVSGNVMSAEFLAQQFQEQDVVISCIGTNTPTLFKVTLYTDTMRSILEAMRTAGVKRLATVTAWGTKYDPKDHGPFWMEWLLNTFLIGRILTNMSEMEDMIMACAQQNDDIKYTVVRPPGLKDAPMTDKLIIAEERNVLHQTPYFISRADVARFILDSLEGDQWHNKAVAIGTES